MKSSALAVITTLSATAILATTAAHAQVRYQVTDLGTLAGVNSHALAINERGQIVGDSTVSEDLSQGVVPVIFEDGTITPLPTQGGPIGAATGINNRGSIVGSLLDANYHGHPSLWENGSLTELPTLGGVSSSASGINGRGDIVGSSATPDGLNHGVIWSHGGITDVGSLEGGNTSAVAINDHGQVVGSSRMIMSGPFSHAYLWSRGTMTDLDPADPLSVATAINNAGIVVGYMGPDPSRVRATMFRDGQVVQLGTLGGRSYAWAINEANQIVGESQDIVTRATHAWIWQDGVFTDLNSLLVDGTDCIVGTARSINDNGQIVGSGRCAGGTVHGLLLTPVTTP